MLVREERAFFPAKSHLRLQQWFAGFFGTSKKSSKFTKYWFFCSCILTVIFLDFFSRFDQVLIILLKNFVNREVKHDVYGKQQK